MGIKCILYWQSIRVLHRYHMQIELAEAKEKPKHPSLLGCVLLFTLFPFRSIYIYNPDYPSSFVRFI